MSWFSNYFQSSPGQVSSDCTACGSSPKSHGAMEAFRESASTGHLGRSQGESARDRVLHRRHAKSSPSHPPIDAAPHGGDTMGKPAILRLIYGFMAQKQKKTQGTKAKGIHALDSVPPNDFATNSGKVRNREKTPTKKNATSLTSPQWLWHERLRWLNNNLR